MTAATMMPTRPPSMRNGTYLGARRTVISRRSAGVSSEAMRSSLLPGELVGLAAAVRRVGERAQEQRHVVVLASVGHGEHQVHLREEGGRAQALVIGPRGEVQPVRPGGEELRTEVLRPAVAIGGA